MVTKMINDNLPLVAYGALVLQPVASFLDQQVAGFAIGAIVGVYGILVHFNVI